MARLSSQYSPPSRPVRLRVTLAPVGVQRLRPCELAYTNNPPGKAGGIRNVSRLERLNGAATRPLAPPKGGRVTSDNYFCVMPGGTHGTVR